MDFFEQGTTKGLEVLGFFPLLFFVTSWKYLCYEYCWIKKNLKLRIDYINDKKILVALNTLVESKTENIIVLSEEQKETIKISKKEYTEGNYFENDAVNEEIEKWLREK